MSYYSHRNHSKTQGCFYNHLLLWELTRCPITLFPSNVALQWPPNEALTLRRSTCQQLHSWTIGGAGKMVQQVKVLLPSLVTEFNHKDPYSRRETKLLCMLPSDLQTWHTMAQMLHTGFKTKRKHIHTKELGEVYFLGSILQSMLPPSDHYSKSSMHLPAHLFLLPAYTISPGRD